MKALKNSDTKTALRAIAFFEAVKGFAALTAGAGLLSLAHRDVRAIAYALIGHFHLDPDGHYPKMLLDDAALLGNANIRDAVLLALVYATVRFLESYGLWRDLAWAEWLATLSGGIYLPIEIDHLLKHATLVNGAVLACNIAIVAFMCYRLLQRRAAARER